MTKHIDNQDDDSNEPVPRDLGEFLKTLQRRLANSKPRSWMRCTSPRCRRERRCADEDMRCQRAQPSAPITEAESAELGATLLRQLRARLQRY